jgi:hypothetical protein
MIETTTRGELFEGVRMRPHIAHFSVATLQVNSGERGLLARKSRQLAETI